MRRIVWLLLAIVLLAACSGEGEKKKVWVSSKGLPSELLLVVDKEVWLSDLQDSINGIVKAQVPGLMQVEDLFRVTRILSKDYAPTHTTFHTKLFIKLGWATLVFPAGRNTMLGMPAFAQ